MFAYSPVAGDAYSERVRYRPRTCFLMTKLGRRVPDDVEEIRRRLRSVLKSREVELIDAESRITGRDILMKIFGMIASVPLGVAIVSENLPKGTIANVFYEIGLLQATGKETLVIKTEGCEIPSDLVRTEYVEFDALAFDGKMGRFLDTFFETGDYYRTLAGELDDNPLLALDYLRRAYLISGNEDLRGRLRKTFRRTMLDSRHFPTWQDLVS